ncbi:MAG: hypothetical protein NT069_13820 [Planctomycetota bacterium]|nr:hypothetical protein [Planctomycetota bacterium]
MESPPQTRPANWSKSPAAVRDFQQALKGYESHTESLRLTQLANSDLELARVAGKYEDFARGVFGYGQALKLWEENQEAREGLRTARREYAQAALDRQNFELGLGQLDADDPTHQPIITRLQAGLNDRDQRKRRETLLKRGVAALLAVIFFGGTLLTLLIYRGKLAADDAKNDALIQKKAADTAKDKAEEATKEAKAQRKAAVDSEKAAVAAKKTAESQRTAADTAKKAAIQSAEEAEDERKKAESAKQVAIDKSNEAETQRRNAEYEAYVAQVGKAITAIENNDYEIAKTIVETIERKLNAPAVSAEGKVEASPLRPGWELRRLQYLLQQAQTLASFPADGDPNRTTEPALSSAKSTLDSEIGAIAVDRSLRRYAIAEQDAQGTIHLGELSLAEGTPQSLTLDRIATLGKPVDSLAFSRNQRLLAAGGNEGRIVLWQVGDHGVQTAVEGAQSFDLSIDNSGNTNVNGVAFIEPTRGSGVGRLWLAAVCSDRGVRLWDLTEFRSGQAARPGPVQNSVKPRVELMGGVQRALAVAPDGTRFVTAGDDGLAVVWNLSPDGTRFQKSESVKTSPATSSASTSETLFSGAFGGHGVPIDSAACSPDGQSVATGGIDGRILIWDPNRSSAPLVASAVEQRGNSLGTMRTLEGHSRTVRSLDYSADGKTLYSASDDRTVCVWNVDPSAPGGPPKVLRGHGDWVRAVRAVNGSAGRRFALSGGNDRRLVLWDVEKYSDQGVVLIEDHTITSLRHTDDVLSGMFNSTGTKLLTASRDRSAIVWNLNPWGDANQILNGSPIRLEEGHTDSAVNTRFLPDGKTAITAGLDGRVCFWDLRTGAQIGLLQDPGIKGIVDVSHDGRWVATGGRENAFVLWSVDEALRAFPRSADPANGIQFPQDLGHRAKVRVVAFSPGPRTRLFTGDIKGGGLLWELDAANPLPPVVIDSHSEQINAAVFSPDGESLLTASDDGSIAVQTLRSPKSLRRLELGSPVRYLAIPPDGSRVFAVVEGDAGSGGWQFHEWDLRSEAHVVRPLGQDVTLVFGLTLDLHASPPAVVVPVGVDRKTRLKRLSVGTEYQDRTTETWQELSTNRARKNARTRTSNSAQDTGFSTVWGAAIDPTTGRLLTVGDVGADLWQFPPIGAGRPDEGKLRVTHQKSLSPHRAVADAAFSLDDQFVATASWDGTFKIWKLDGQSARVWHRVQADRRQPPPPGAGDAPALPDPALQMARGAVNSIRFFQGSAGDGGSTVRLLTAHQNGDVVVWNWNGTQEEEPREQSFVATKPVREAFCVRAALVGDQVLIVATYAGGMAKLYEFSPDRGELRERGEFQGDDAAKHDEKDVLCGAISTDGKWAATGDRDGRIIVWNMETRTPWLKVLRGHSTEITSLAFSDSSRSEANSTVGNEDPLANTGHYGALRLVSGSRDGTAKLWDPRTSFVSTRGNGERLEANDLMTLRLTLDGPASRSEMGGVTAVDISPAGDSIVTVGQLENGSEQKILLWRAMPAETPGK